MKKEQCQQKEKMESELYETILFFIKVAKETKNSAILRDIAELYKEL